MPFGLFDPTMLLLVPAMICAFWAQWKVTHTYRRYSLVRAANGLTGSQIARAIMNRNGVTGVAVEEVGGASSDHYAPNALRSAIAPVAGFGSTLAFPLLFIGFIFQSGALAWLMDLGIVFFAGAVVFHLVTLPVECDASKRALSELTSSGALAPNEVVGGKKVLDAAALTYATAAAMAALQLVRLVLLHRGRG